MSPLTAALKRTRTILSKSAHNQQPHDDRSNAKDFDDHHHHHHQYTTHSSIHTYMSNFRLKLRHMGSPDVRSKFTFSKLDTSKAKIPHFTLHNGIIDRYIIANSQTVPNDSTEHKRLAMFALHGRSPRPSAGSSNNRRSSFCGTARLRRYSVSGSDLTVASEDLTASQFAKHCGINVYPEEEDEIFEDDISILIHQQPAHGTPVHSTVRSSTRSVKSKISIMEDTFWTPPPSNDLDRSDEEAMPRMSMDSSNADGLEAYMQSDMHGRRNSLITFAESPSVTKIKRDVAGPPKHGVRPGRHSSPIPIPSPKPILVHKSSQLFQRCVPPDATDMQFSSSAESPSSSLSLSYTSLMNRSTTSSVSTMLTIPTSPKMSSTTDDEGDGSSEPPIVAIIKGERHLTESATERERAPITVIKGRFEVTIGDLPPPDVPRSSTDSNRQ